MESFPKIDCLQKINLPNNNLSDFAVKNKCDDFKLV